MTRFVLRTLDSCFLSQKASGSDANVILPSQEDVVALMEQAYVRTVIHMYWRQNPQSSRAWRLAHVRCLAPESPPSGMD